MYLSSSTDDSGLSEEDSKTIRVSLFNLIKYYIIRDITADELGQLLGFLLAVKTQDLVIDSFKEIFIWSYTTFLHFKFLFYKCCNMHYFLNDTLASFKRLGLV